ncbi:uroporphyrinogen decarboxylase [Sphingobium sp. LB126]|uniref:uroporphyrinogen decarboxylase n=1 Tax=Sphingobium sp. LB126 TaxID=1983755 RepID=UPI000C20099D|nr:uroporphyrinogen decarboxylase [Sphingobium sp. LB126]PJG47155.1 uroporphyrinogen decarboxylase [Sphingobium sp. LB126]
MTFSRSCPSTKPLLRVLSGERVDRPPVWFMRQAGRYLPEYRDLRARKGSFLDLCYDPEAAAEATLQPIARFAMDAAILFSDILVVPHAMGQDLHFAEGEGPILAPTLDATDLDALDPRLDRLEPVYRTVALVAAALPKATALIGFAGAPWTVATYMIAGRGSRDQAAARTMAFRDPDRLQGLIDRIVDVTVTYLSGQIAAGAEAVQLFDSWAGSLSPVEFERWVIAPTAQIIGSLSALHPDIPIIGFPKGAGTRLPAYVLETGVDAIGLDETIPPEWADRLLPPEFPVQGNLDPLALLAGGGALKREAARILFTFRDRPHIFNLGHGIVPQVPIEHVEQLLAEIRA